MNNEQNNFLYYEETAKWKEEEITVTFVNIIDNNIHFHRIYCAFEFCLFSSFTLCLDIRKWLKFLLLFFSHIER